MPSAAAKAAKRLVQQATAGAIRRGHLGIYDLINAKLRAAREGLAGREDLLQYDKIRRALDAKVEELTKALQDPSVADRACMVDGVHKLLRACIPLYDALNKDRSLKEACDALDDAERTLDRVADEDAEYKEYRKLHGGWVTIHGKRKKLNAKDFAKWQAANKQSNRNFTENPYKYTAQTTEEHVDAFKSKQKAKKREGDRLKRHTKKAKTEDDAPTPPNLEMRVMPDESKKYRPRTSIFQYGPKGKKNCWTTKEAAMELLALCEANRPAGRGREAKQAALTQEGRAPGVHPHRGHGYRARLMPKKKTHVVLKAPGGGFVFDTAAAAGDAIEKYEKAGSPTKPSDPMYDTLVHHVERRKQ